MTKEQALAKIKELQEYINRIENEWVKIGYDQIPKEVFDSYGAKPFEIMKRKMYKDDEVWNNISWENSKIEVQKLGYRLPSIQEMLVLLYWYRHEKGDRVSYKDKEFLGIEELSWNENVCYEWIDAPVQCLRGASWNNGSTAGAFSLNLNGSTGDTLDSVGFRCAR